MAGRNGAANGDDALGGADPGPGEGEADRAGGGVLPAAAWTFAFLILRIFAVSGYDWTTAFAVSRTLGVDDGLSILFGSFMARHVVVAMMLVVVVPLLIATYLWSPSGRRPVVILATAVGLLMLLTISASFHTWWVPVITFAMVGLFAAVRRLEPSHRLRRELAAAVGRVGWVAAVAGLVVAVFVQTPWVPREQIETRTGTITGYVLSVDPGYLNVLTEDHEFVILLSGDVLRRT